MNGYFQIVQQNNRCCIKLVPPTDGGTPVKTEDLTEYLSIKNITYDLKGLVAVLSNLSEPTVFPTNTPFTTKDSEYCKVNCAPDNMSVSVFMVPPYDGGSTMSRDEFMR